MTRDAENRKSQESGALSAAKRHGSTIQVGRWFFGVTIRRLSFFAAIKSDSTWRNYARLLEHIDDFGGPDV